MKQYGLPKPPPRRRVSRLERPRTSALERTRGIVDRERPFDPGQRGSWRGRSSDLVVNARGPKLKTGYAYEYEDINERDDWKQVSDESWNTRMLSESSIRGARYVGTRMIDGSRMCVFKKPRTYGYYAQMENYTRNAAVDDDVPNGLHMIEFRYHDAPEANGEHVRYGDFQNGAADEGLAQWYEVEPAGGSDYSGGSVTKANYNSLKEMLEEAHPSGQEPAVWADAHGGHGTYSILVVWDQLDSSIQETLNGLDDYPVIDEEAMSNEESERENEAWEQWVRRDFEKKFIKSLNAEMQTGSGDRPDSDYEIDDWPDDVDSYRLFHIAKETSNTEWIHESGDSVYIDLDRVVDGKYNAYTKVIGAIQLVVEGQRPDWLSADDDKYLDELDEALGLERQ